MTAQTLTPTQLVPNAAGLDLTATLATPTQTTLQFTNTGKEFLAVAAAATLETVTLNIGVTILGQTVTNFTAVDLTNAHTYLFGPFSSQVDTPGTATATVVLSTTTSISVALLQFVGVS
jgi:hypothetical protein